MHNWHKNTNHASFSSLQYYVKTVLLQNRYLGAPGDGWTWNRVILHCFEPTSSIWLLPFSFSPTLSHADRTHTFSAVMYLGIYTATSIFFEVTCFPACAVVRLPEKAPSNVINRKVADYDMLNELGYMLHKVRRIFLLFLHRIWLLVTRMPFCILLIAFIGLLGRSLALE